MAVEKSGSMNFAIGQSKKALIMIKGSSAQRSKDNKGRLEDTNHLPGSLLTKKVLYL